MDSAFLYLRQTIEGWGFSPSLSQVLLVATVWTIVVSLSFLADFITRRFLLRAVSFFVSKSAVKWDDILLKRNVFSQLSHLAPALVVNIFAPVLAAGNITVETFLRRLTLAYIVLITCFVIHALLNAVEEIYRGYKLSRERPIRAYLQVVIILVYLVGGIIIISILIDKSPWALLSGLGALTAVLMLVFKDSILGFVASIQLAGNNMVRVGDWIEMPKFGADGDVIDVTLNTVKVQNWDKTISTIPTYQLVSESFKNWRGMEQSGGRRIKRSLSIDMSTVKFCEPALLERMKKIHLLKDYLEERSQEIASYNQGNKIDKTLEVNGRQLTNLGVFRAYLERYLAKNPDIRQDMTFLIRQLPPTEVGLPLEIYVFSADQRWANYEAIQADIFDHILASLEYFDLQVFQSPSGQDFRQLMGTSRGL